MGPPDAPPPGKRLKQQSIERYDQSKTQLTEIACALQVDCFLYEGCSFLLADSARLRTWLEAYRKGSGLVLGRRQVAARAAQRVAGVKQQVVDRLRACKGVTVGIDGWTNVRGDKVINVCPVGRGIAYYWDSLVMHGYATADDQHPLIANALRKLIAQGILVAGLVTDNEQVNVALFRKLANDFPFLIHIPCAAHTIQLCVKKAMKLPGIEDAIGTLLAMITAWKHSKDVRVLLSQQQALLHRGDKELKLIKVVVTRWNSIYYAGQRVLLLEDCLRPCIPAILTQLRKEKNKARYATYTFDDQSFWHPLRTVVDFFASYKTATDVVQSDAACLADVHREFLRLATQVDELGVLHPFAPFKAQLARILRREWHNHVNKNAIVVCAQFSFHSSYQSFPAEQRSQAEDWFFSWGKQFLAEYNLSRFTDHDLIEDALLQQHSHFLTRSSVFASLDQRRAVKERAAAANHQPYDPREIWGLYLETATELAACALALLELTASEAAVERSFSRQGLVHSKARNRLSDDSVQLQMAFAFNTRALEPKLNLPEWEEEVPEDEDEASSSNIALLYKADDEIAAAADSEEDEEEAESATLEIAAGSAEIIFPQIVERDEELKEDDHLEGKYSEEYSDEGEHVDEEEEEEEEKEESVALLTRSGSTIEREKLEMLITKVIRDVGLTKVNWRKKKAELDNYIEKVAVLDEVHTSTGTLVKLIKDRVNALAQLA
jgi:hypothetical protein